MKQVTQASKIGDNIKTFRQRKKISQDRLSKLADLSLNTIARIESGANPNPTVDTVGRIASALQVRIDDLFHG